jgi:hypothetical protein
LGSSDEVEWFGIGVVLLEHDLLDIKLFRFAGLGNSNLIGSTFIGGN